MDFDFEAYEAEPTLIKTIYHDRRHRRGRRGRRR
jgi:hypothetical protein